MKYKLLVILTVLTLPSLAQDIEKIIFTSQQTDEPPTKQGRPKYIIEFTRQETGGLIASDIFVGMKTKKLARKVMIDMENVETVTRWIRQNRRTFTLFDLGLDIATLKTKENNYELNFMLPLDLIVNVDSFQFCQGYKMTKTISTGGETLAITLIYKDVGKDEFIFHSDDIGKGRFILKDYILCYALLHDRIPYGVPGRDFFLKDKFADIVLYYQKTAECEGYYYREFTDKHPDMTSMDRRRKTGWNFVEYMTQRKKEE